MKYSPFIRKNESNISSSAQTAPPPSADSYIEACFNSGAASVLCFSNDLLVPTELVLLLDGRYSFQKAAPRNACAKQNASAVRPDSPSPFRSKLFTARPDVFNRNSSFVAVGSSEQPRTPLRQRQYTPRPIWNTPTTAEGTTASMMNGLSSVEGRDFPVHAGSRSLTFSSSGRMSTRMANKRTGLGTGFREMFLGVSRERSNFEELPGSRELATRKEVQRILEKKLSASRGAPVFGNARFSSEGGDIVQAEERVSDIKQLEEYKRCVTLLQGGGERFSVTKASVKLQETISQFSKSPPAEALSNGVVRKSGDYSAVDNYKSAENDGNKDLASSSAHLDGNQGENSGDWRELYEKSNRRNPKLSSLKLEQEYLEKRFAALSVTRPSTFNKPHKEERETADAFTPLSEEAEREVDDALRGPDRNKVLTFHEKSGIDVTRAVMQCLLPGAWLNDEVINLYMELLKEREVQEPKKFLKCHFFNTFFYNKLYKDKRSYDYKAVRRWTTQKKVGYSLADCDKILVPIHQDIHWCLAVINIRDKKFEYLDSLGGVDNAVLKVLARYIADEAKDKGGIELDSSTWDIAFPQDIPQQLNGCDCGMFMLKYADFHSRGVSLSFKQADMEYFRRRMVWELLRLKAGT
ncbi:hypothetical protein R1flu_001080 [Riccia fluitans]|uniref:Ubiquitin-like protease family profile domain-containing protein n=1 Tax=Riccia fluitans TaxID=41844 RepID=A0ABD1Y2B6_9MARC